MTVHTPIVDEDIRFVLSECRDELRLLAGRTLLITGASGFVGSYLVESIIAYNRNQSGPPCELLLPTRSLDATRAKWPQFFGVDHVRWFVWDGRTINPPVTHCDYIIHGASPSDPGHYMNDPMSAMEDIALGTSAVLRYAQEAGAKKLVYLSSGAAYGQQPDDVPKLTEDNRMAPDLLLPSSCYGEAKRYSELLCRTSGVPSIIVRLFAFMGPYQDIEGGFAVPDFFRQALKDKSIRIHSDGSAMRTYCYASDLAISLWKLMLKGDEGALYNVGSDSPVVSIRELADMIARLIGGVRIITEGRVSAGSRSRYIPCIDKVKTLYAPQIDLMEALRRTFLSYQSVLGRA